MKHLLVILAALCCLSASAASKKKAKKTETPAAERVDTLSLHDFSYLLGKMYTNGLKQYLTQNKGIGEEYMADFLVGFDAGAPSEGDLRMKARLAGQEIRQQLENGIMPQAARQINDSTDMLQHERFVKGFRAGITGQDTEFAIPEDSVQALVSKQLEYYQTERMERKYGQNRRAGEEFLKQNAKQKGVVVTPSGLQYKVLTKGEGPVPTATQKVKVNYEGRLVDGTVFDSSYKRGEPTTFACNQVIKGWTEALTLMPVGSKWELYIPQQLAYGERETGNIPPLSALIFTVELLDIEK